MDATNFVFSHPINNGYKQLMTYQYQNYFNIINYIDPSFKRGRNMLKDTNTPYTSKTNKLSISITPKKPDMYKL